MYQKLALLLGCVCLTACGASRATKENVAYAPAQEPAQAAEESVSISPPDEQEWRDSAEIGGSLAPPASSDFLVKPARLTETSGSVSATALRETAKPTQPPAQSDAPTETEPSRDPAEPQRLTPMVVYNGYLKLRVPRLLESVDQILKLTEQHAGYVESLTHKVVVVRIPARDFDAVLASFAALGDVLNRRISAHDVSAQFSDLSARLTIAELARQRLLILLEKVVDVDQRLAIMREIKRLTEQIESISSRLSTLRNLVDFFTITIELQPIMEDTDSDPSNAVLRSPFMWIRDLQAHATTLFEGNDDFALALPTEFVLFDESDEYRAQAADTSVIRADAIDNEPRGTSQFWLDAVIFEMVARGEVIQAQDTSGRMAYGVFRSQDIKPRYYLVALYAAGDDLYVLEAFFPNQAAFAAHGDNVIKSLATFEVK